MLLNRLARDAPPLIFTIDQHAGSLEPDTADPKEFVLTIECYVEWQCADAPAQIADRSEPFAFTVPKLVLQQHDQVDIAIWPRLANRIAADQVVAAHALGQALLDQCDDLAKNLVD